VSLKIEVTGIAEALKKVQEVEDLLKKKIIREAARKASRPLIDSAKAKAPRSKKKHHRYRDGKIVATYEPGNLAESIAFFKPKKQINYNTLIYAVAPRMGSGRKFDGWYAHFIEYGTADQEAQAFMRPAFEETKGVINATMSDEILNAVEKFK
jgi:HK97 gp10 family phage protein